MILLSIFAGFCAFWAFLHDVVTSDIPTLEWFLTWLDVGWFYGSANSLYWLFGFKYWVIGKEMNEMLGDDDEDDDNQDETRELGGKFWTEERYNLVRNVGLSVNITVCCVLGSFRGFANVLAIDKDVPTPEWLNNTIMALYLTQCSLLLVSVVFLGMALTLLGKQFHDG